MRYAKPSRKHRTDYASETMTAELYAGLSARHNSAVLVPYPKKHVLVSAPSIASSKLPHAQKLAHADGTEPARIG